jgi:hypothetical protein
MVDQLLAGDGTGSLKGFLVSKGLTVSIMLRSAKDVMYATVCRKKDKNGHLIWPLI